MKGLKNFDEILLAAYLMTAIKVQGQTDDLLDLALAEWHGASVDNGVVHGRSSHRVYDGPARLARPSYL